jgi:transposase
VAPVFLKRISRIESLLFLCFLALLVQALLERKVRSALAREQIASPRLRSRDQSVSSPDEGTAPTVAWRDRATTA